jgi:hypothetical protein
VTSGRVLRPAMATVPPRRRIRGQLSLTFR